MMDAMEVAAALRRAAENAGCGTHAVASGSGYCPDGSCGECVERSRAWFSEAADAIERCAMPEGVKWPRFEDGEPVGIGDMAVLADGNPHEVESIEFLADKSCKLKGKGTPWMQTVFKGQRARRPPVLAADGEPLEVGQTVWDVESGTEYEVVSIYIDEENPVRVMRTDGSHLAKATKPNTFTHQRPVLDADGVPIRVGDTVYFTDGREQKCNTVVHAKYDYKDEPYVQFGRLNEAGYPTYTNCSCIDPSQLTHTKPEPPDTWERIEEDATLSPREYYARYVGHDVGLKDDEEVNGAFGNSLVRRCKALAGVIE